MQATTPKRRAKKLPPELFQVVLQMQARWPEAINIDAPKPLAIGVHRQIQQELGLAAATGSVMRWYTRRFAYRQALEAGEHRYHLDVTIAAAVKDDERPSAIAKRQGRPPASAASAAAPRFSWQELAANKEILMADAPAIRAFRYQWRSCYFEHDRRLSWKDSRWQNSRGERYDANDFSDHYFFYSFFRGSGCN